MKGETLEAGLQSRYQIFDEVRHIPSGKFRRYHGENLLSHLIDVRTLALNTRDFFRVLAGIGSARRVLKEVKPDVVFSKGGFVVVPVGIAAKLQRIPIVTHDSDTVPGLANRIIGRFAQAHAVGTSDGLYPYPKESIYHTGIPLDERIKPVTVTAQAAFKKQLSIAPNSLVLLVGGAGLGARDVNNLVLAAAPELLSRFPDLRIIHLAGHKHQEEVAGKYQLLSASERQRVRVLGFTPDFYRYTGAADLIITRAGATTIAELSLQRKPLILIPAPHLSGGHQLKNAAELEKHKAAKVIANDINPEQLVELVSEILTDKTQRLQMAERIGELAKPDAADRLAELLVKAARAHRVE